MRENGIHYVLPARDHVPNFEFLSSSQRFDVYEVKRGVRSRYFVRSMCS
jgi:hypothetical protein